MARTRATGTRTRDAGRAGLYTLRVSLLSGPITEEFARKNKTVSRTIQIRGDQTLQRLHEAIFDAFDRDDEHMYEFQFGKGPHDRKGQRYVLPMVMDDPFDPADRRAKSLTRTTIGALGLKANQSFGYWFDFGDDWYHQIDVVDVADDVPKGRYPQITERIGESPPQYIDWDEEGDP